MEQRCDWGSTAGATERGPGSGGGRDAWLRTVSHELRTPLAVIVGYADILATAEAALAPEYRDMVARLALNARKLDRLLTDLIDLDRLGRGSLAPHPTGVDVGAAVDAVMADLRLADHPVTV